MRAYPWHALPRVDRAEARWTATLADRIDADAEIRKNPTGRVVSMREPSTLLANDDDRYRIVPR